MRGGRKRLQLSLTSAVLVISMPATLSGCFDSEKLCAPAACSNQIVFEVHNVSFERRNVAQAEVCFDRDCRTGTARFNATREGEFGSNGIGITPTGNSLLVTRELPLRAEWDEETSHDMSLQLSLNGGTWGVAHTQALDRSEPNGPGCGVCWGVHIEAQVTPALWLAGLSEAAEA